MNTLTETRTGGWDENVDVDGGRYYPDDNTFARRSADDARKKSRRFHQDDGNLRTTVVDPSLLLLPYPSCCSCLDGDVTLRAEDELWRTNLSIGDGLFGLVFKIDSAEGSYHTHAISRRFLICFLFFLSSSSLSQSPFRPHTRGLPRLPLTRYLWWNRWTPTCQREQTRWS